MRVPASLLAVVLIAGACSGSASVPATPHLYRLGMFHVGLDHTPPSRDALEQALTEDGYVEGRDISYEWVNLADEAAADVTARTFVEEKVDLIVAFENQTARASQRATSTIPVVFVHVTDPVAQGFVADLSHPGGNMTGLVGYRVLTGKQLEMFHNVMPSLRRILMLNDPTDPVGATLRKQALDTAAALNLTVLEREVSTQDEIGQAFDSVAPDEVDGVFVVSQTLHTKFSSILVDNAVAHRLPIVVNRRDWVERGGLLTYSPKYPEVGRAAAVYVDKILKGAKPGDLAVEEMTQLELAINVKIAREFGLTLSPTLVDSADYVVQ